MDQAPKISFRPPPAPSSALLVEPGVYHYSAWQNINIGVWVGQATLRAAQGLLLIGKEMSRRYPGGHSSIVFVLDRLPAPTPEARELLGQLFKAGSELACTAVILEGSGFWASGLRSMIANMHRTAAGAVRLRVGTSVDEALDWFPAEHERCTGIMVDVAQLRMALLSAREHGAAAALKA
jgi:hypothetical protein